MKNILAFSFFPAFVPPKNGGQVRLFNFYQSLSKHYHITLLSSSHTGVTEEVIQHTPTFIERRIPKDVHFINTWASLEKHSSGGDLSAVVLAASGVHFTLLHQAYLDAYPQADIIIHDSPFTESYDMFKACDKKLRIYNAYNCETDLYKTLHPSANSDAIHAIVETAEANLLHHSDLVFYCNSNDEARFRQIAQHAHFASHFVPNGMTPGYHSKPATKLHHERNVIFIGSSHPPNVNAAKFITEELANKLPNIIFHIVGGCLTKGKHKSNVRVHGQVSDEEKNRLLQNADFALNPMLEGSGSNLKVLDYFSHALPIISTKFGMRGINATPSEHYIESTLNDFSAVIEQSFIDSNMQKIGLNGASLALEHYTWQAIAESASNAIESAYKTFIESKQEGLVLVLNDYDSFSGVGGGCTRTQGLCEAVSEQSKVAFLCFSSNNQYSVRQENPNLTLFAVAKTQPHLAEVLKMNAQFHVASDDIIASQFCTKNALINQIYFCLRDQADHIMVEHCYMTPIAMQHGDQFIYSSHNIEATLKANLLQHHPFHDALISQVDAVERAAVENATAILAVSDEDAQALIRGKRTAASPLVIRNGAEPPVDLAPHTEIVSEIKSKIAPNAIVFLGSAHMPNVLSAQFILSQIAPAFSHLQFHIVGSVCQTLHQSLPKNVVLWGEVSKEKKTAILQNCSLALNPMLSGGGSNIKLADYLMHGLYVLTTPFGIRGYPNSVLPHTKVAELDCFVEAITRILESSEIKAINKLDRQSQFAKELSMRGYATGLLDLLKSKKKPKKRVLFVTYRYGYPHLGGAEQMLAQLMQGLACTDEFTIDIVAPEVSQMTNTWRFSEQYQFDPSTSGQINLPNIRFARFPVSDLDNTTLCNRLKDAWLAQAHFDQELNAQFTHKNTGLTYGWGYPESLEKSSARWAFISCGIHFADQGNVQLKGYIDAAAFITVINDNGEMITSAEINGNFALSFDLLQSENIHITTSSTLVDRDDPRPLAFVAQEILHNNQAINLSQQTLLNSALQRYETKDIFDLLHDASVKSRHLTNTKLTESRGPFSDDLTTFIHQKIAAYDLVITHNPVFHPAILAINAAKKHNIPSILIPHAHLDDDFYHFPDFLECAKNASLVLAAPQTACEFFSKLGCNVAYLPAGIDTQEQFTTQDIAAFEQVYSQKTPFILVLGRKSSAKNYHQAITAVESINRSGVRLNVVLIGPDDDQVSIDSEVATYLGLQAREVVRGALMQCKMLVNMSSSESFGIVLLEAWLANKPVIANKECAAFHDIAQDGVNALLVNQLTLESSIFQLLNDSELATALAKNGRAVAERYGWSEINRQFIKECHHLMMLNA